MKNENFKKQSTLKEATKPILNIVNHNLKRFMCYSKVFSYFNRAKK